MVLSCNIFFQGLSDTAFFLVQTWCFYHKKIVTWKLQHFYHKEVMMLSFFHGWEIIVESVNLTQMSKQKIIITMMENNYFLIGISEKWDRAPGTRDSGLIRGTWVPGERSQVEVPGSRVPCMGPASWVPGPGSHFSGISFLYQNTELKNDVLLIFMLLLYIIARNEEFQIIDKNCTQENVKCHNSTLTRMNRNWTGKLRVFSVKVRIKYINQYKFAISCCGIMKATILLC